MKIGAGIQRLIRRSILGVALTPVADFTPFRWFAACNLPLRAPAGLLESGRR